MFLLVAFSGVTVLLTVYAVQYTQYINEIKERDGYHYHKNDLRFKTKTSILSMAFVCMFAAILCGLTGIAGGMVLGPLFLKYNMHEYTFILTQ